ncbi:MAG: hypothetical protein JRI63_08415 [Deltaproteobacteria bacterium]|nr:hypothetical protein [Deltaproteobacteria bacterium]MBW2088809.1 hypothetical protein [Deltaproteobacteria bacterium]
MPKIKLINTLFKHKKTLENKSCLKMVIKTKINNARIIPIEDELFEAKVFEIIGHNLEFTGLCPECSKKIHTNDH